jgi:carbonic anhydrase
VPGTRRPWAPSGRSPRAAADPLADCRPGIRHNLSDDLPAGLVVFLVALPLCLGIALASGAPLFSGLIAGAFQLLLGVLRAGVLGDYVPNAVIKGMLAAIGVVILLKQIPHALGRDADYEGDFDFFETMGGESNSLLDILNAASSASPAAVAITAVSLAILHRNIANLVIHTDFNMLSVLQYAVDVLKVKHIIVCGHYGCGGVVNALSHRHLGLINKWLRNIKDVYRIHQRELEGIPAPDLRWRRMVELNVEEQLWKLAETSFVQQAWRREQRPTLHGWVYDLKTGYLNDLSMLDHTAQINDIDKFDFES